MNEKIKSLLQKDPVKNIATIGFFGSYLVDEYYMEGNSAIIFGRSDNAVLLGIMMGGVNLFAFFLEKTMLF